jgi:hypothetical protein
VPVGRGITGQVDRDISDLTLVMEPGERGPHNSNMKPPPGIELHPEERPLRAAKLTPAAARTP